MTLQPTATAVETARLARIASSELARIDGTRRKQALDLLATKLEERVGQIMEANESDCLVAAEAVKRGDMTAALFKRLRLDENKIQSVIDGVRQIAAQPDSLGQVELARELDDGLRLFRVRCPIGVILVIFEARPDALPQIASLLIKSGNAGLLKGGREAQHSNEALMACIEEALIECAFPRGAYALVPGRHEVAELLKMDKFVDLVIPRGSSELVRQIQASTTIPVLGHAEGICHLYVHEDADLDMALKLTIDAKTNYPAACNSIETLLVHRHAAAKFIPMLLNAAVEAGVALRMTPGDATAFGAAGNPAVGVANDADWTTEYSDLILAVKVVDSLSQAVVHINEFGSGHTESVVTRDKRAFDIFFAEVNSAGVFWNASTRFADGFRYGFGAEVGISTGKLHPRGPVGVDGITTYKYRLEGNGQVVADYTGDGARKFKHTDLPVDKHARNNDTGG